MKYVYIIYDKTAQEIVMCFLANNNKHAIKMISNDLQKKPLDIEFDIYQVCELDVNDTKKLCSVYLDKNESKPIFSYPQSENMDEDEVKENIKIGE